MSRARAVRWVRVAVVVGAVGALEIACRTGIIKPLTMIAPSEMAASMVALLASGEITGDIVRTLATVAVALVTSVLGGFALGALVQRLPRVRRAMDPLLASYYAVPVFVFYPLMVAVFGLNMLPLVCIALAFATPAMMIATILGLDRVPQVMHKVARVHRLSRWQSVVLVVLPAAMPNLFNGLRLALAYSLIGVIAGEFILSSGGLGFGISYAYDSFQNRKMYGIMLFVLLVSILVNGLLSAWETRLVRRRQRA